MESKNLRPSVIKDGVIFYLTTAFPPVSAGSSVINRNLLSHYDEESFVLLKSKTDIESKIGGKAPKYTYNIFRAYYKFPKIVNNFLGNAQLYVSVLRVLSLIKKHKPQAIVSVYPNYHFLKIGRIVSKISGVPHFPYLHDTVAEALSNTPLASKAEKLQSQVFNESARIFVMSKGMQVLYKAKYNIDSVPLLHSYLEPISDELQPADFMKAFWGGDIYDINLASFSRLTKVLAQLNISVNCATSKSIKILQRSGIDTENISVNFYGDRKEYLKVVSSHGLLLLALSWPDESKIHEDELGTIFPTKTPEYLASGNLIVVHCPSNYFLARFLQENECGIVIDTKSPQEMQQQLQSALADVENVNRLRKNALKAAEMFKIERVASVFSNNIAEALNKDAKQPVPTAVL